MKFDAGLGSFQKLSIEFNRLKDTAQTILFKNPINTAQ